MIQSMLHPRRRTFIHTQIYNEIKLRVRIKTYVRQFLIVTFPNTRMGRDGPISWSRVRKKLPP